VPVDPVRPSTTNDPAVLIAPTGEAIDGRRLLAEAVGFGRALRRSGLAIDLASEIDFARALGIVDVGRREIVHDAGAAMFVRRRDDRPVYDRVFDRYWRRRGRSLPMGPAVPELPDAPRDEGEPGPADQAQDAAEGEGKDTSPFGAQVAGDADEGDEIEGVTVSPDAYSASEVMRHRDFDRMTSTELREAERLVDLLTPRLELRRTRRHELHPHGRRIAPREMLRRNLATGGDLTTWLWRRPVYRPRRLVVLCDISGSMERHSRLLLRFIQALTRTSEVRAESFVFGTRLTRVTRLLKDRDRDRALARVADTVNDWAGGTRIGESFREFNHKWARRTLRTSGVVIVVSDGWDRGDPALVAAETARLRRNCHRLVWLNPLASAPGYQPLAAGMKAAYPYIDDFVPAGTLASLEMLGELLAGARIGSRLSGRAVTAATTVSPSAGLTATSPDIRTPPPLDDHTADPSAARPLR
jgi:uncharacterized protein with von Willebrand factor type A (vWA) domain